MDKGVRTAEGVLVALKQRLMHAAGVRNDDLRRLLDMYVRRMPGLNLRAANTTKINTYNKLSSDRLTIKGLFEFFLILRLSEITMTFNLELHTGEKYSVSESAALPLAAGEAGPEAFLVKIRQAIMRVAHLSRAKLDTLVCKRLAEQSVVDPTQTAASAKTNILNKLLADKLTMKGLFEFFAVLDVVRVEIILTATLASGDTLTVTEALRTPKFKGTVST